MADHGGAFAPSPGCCFFCYQDQDKEGASTKLTEKDITPHTSSCFLPSLWAMPSQNVAKSAENPPEKAASRSGSEQGYCHQGAKQKRAATFAAPRSGACEAF